MGHQDQYHNTKDQQDHAKDVVLTRAIDTQTIPFLSIRDERSYERIITVSSKGWNCRKRRNIDSNDFTKMSDISSAIASAPVPVTEKKTNEVLAEKHYEQQPHRSPTSLSTKYPQDPKEDSFSILPLQSAPKQKYSYKTNQFCTSRYGMYRTIQQRPNEIHNYPIYSEQTPSTGCSEEILHNSHNSNHDKNLSPRDNQQNDQNTQKHHYPHRQGVEAGRNVSMLRDITNYYSHDFHHGTRSRSASFSKARISKTIKRAKYSYGKEFKDSGMNFGSRPPPPLAHKQSYYDVSPAETYHRSNLPPRSEVYRNSSAGRVLNLHQTPIVTTVPTASSYHDSLNCDNIGNEPFQTRHEQNHFEQCKNMEKYSIRTQPLPRQQHITPKNPNNDYRHSQHYHGSNNDVLYRNNSLRPTPPPSLSAYPVEQDENPSQQSDRHYYHRNNYTMNISQTITHKNTLVSSSERPKSKELTLGHKMNTETSFERTRQDEFFTSRGDDLKSSLCKNSNDNSSISSVEANNHPSKRSCHTKRGDCSLLKKRRINYADNDNEQKQLQDQVKTKNNIKDDHFTIDEPPQGKNTHSVSICKDSKNVSSTPDTKTQISSCSNNNSAAKKKQAKPVKKFKKMYSDYVGVTYNKTHRKFQTCITHYRRQHYLGRYLLAVDAARAYDVSARSLKGLNWKINFETDEKFYEARSKELDERDRRLGSCANDNDGRSNTKRRSRLKNSPQNRCLLPEGIELSLASSSLAINSKSIKNDKISNSLPASNPVTSKCSTPAGKVKCVGKVTVVTPDESRNSENRISCPTPSSFPSSKSQTLILDNVQENCIPSLKFSSSSSSSSSSESLGGLDCPETNIGNCAKSVNMGEKTKNLHDDFQDSAIQTTSINAHIKKGVDYCGDNCHVMKSTSYVELKEEDVSYRVDDSDDNNVSRNLSDVLLGCNQTCTDHVLSSNCKKKHSQQHDNRLRPLISIKVKCFQEQRDVNVVDIPTTPPPIAIESGTSTPKGIERPSSLSTSPRVVSSDMSSALSTNCHENDDDHHFNNPVSTDTSVTSQSQSQTLNDNLILSTSLSATSAAVAGIKYYDHKTNMSCQHHGKDVNANIPMACIDTNPSTNIKALEAASALMNLICGN